MVEVYFSTTIRSSPLHVSGELIKLDWPSKTILKKTLIAPHGITKDPNPRGNTRGGRGIHLLNDQIIVASYDTLVIFDQDFNLQGEFSHSLMVGLHEFCPSSDNKLWMTSTDIDAILEYDIVSRAMIGNYWPREMPHLQKALRLHPRQINKQADNRLLYLEGRPAEDTHLHLNACYWWQGDMYALFNAYGVVANLSRDAVWIQDPTLKGSHNLMIIDDGTLFINDSWGRTIRLYDMHTRQQKQSIDLTQFKWVRNLARRYYLGYTAKNVLKILRMGRIPVARPIFVRGLDVVDEHVFVGISPVAILQINWRTGTLVDTFQYTTDVHHAVHGLKVAVA